MVEENKDKKNKEEGCPLCKVSEETIKILKEKAPAFAKASAGKKDKKI